METEKICIISEMEDALQERDLPLYSLNIIIPLKDLKRITVDTGSTTQQRES